MTLWRNGRGESPLFRTLIKTGLAVLLLAVFAPQQAPADASPLPSSGSDRRLFCDALYERMNFYYPDAGMTEPFRVAPSLHVDDISRIDGRHFEFDAGYLLYLAWQDPRVADLLKELGRFDETDVEWLCDWRQEEIWGNQKKLFDPTIEFKKRVTEINFNTDRADYIEVYSDGSLVARTRDFSTFRSTFDLRLFPFDSQTLRLTLEPEFTTDMVVFDTGTAFRQLQSWIPIHTLTEDFQGTMTPEWEITDIRSGLEDHYQLGLHYSNFVKEIEVRRKAGYYVVRIFLPMMFLFALCWSVLWIHTSELQAQVNVTIVAFLSLIAYHLSLSDELPRVNYLTFIDAFIFFSYLFTGSATLFCILLHNLHRYVNTDRIVYYARFMGPVLYLAGISCLTFYYLVVY